MGLPVLFSCHSRPPLIGAACLREKDSGHTAKRHFNCTQAIGETNMKTLKTLKAELLADPATHAEYVSVAREFEMARELIAARSRAGLTQGEVAERMGTTQSVVARLESGRRAPSMRTVQRYAQAVGARAVVHLEVA
jgi:DNA-binding XRE family transcriptional regulator